MPSHSRGGDGPGMQAGRRPKIWRYARSLGGTLVGCVQAGLEMPQRKGHPSSVSVAYADFERSDKDTEREVGAAGFTFTPVVCEAHKGGLALECPQTHNLLCWPKEAAATSGEVPFHVSLRFAECTSMSLQRSSARAIL